MLDIPYIFRPVKARVDGAGRFCYVAPMAETVKVLINLTRDLVERIEEFRWANRIASRSEAIRRLVERGLRPEAPPAKAPPRKGRARG